MSWIFIVVVIFILVVLALTKLAPQSQREKNVHHYQKIGALFTPAERSFLGVLKLAIDNELEVFGKVRVADVIKPKKGQNRSDWQISFNKISAKHFDFVLCKNDDLTPVCVVELNDSSHNSKQRQKRDEFLRSACNSANLSLVEIKAKATYQVSEIRESLSAYLSQEKPIQIADPQSEVKPEKATYQKLCPKCSSVMALKVAKKGKNVGNKFWTCTAFPKCRYTESDKLVS